MSNVMLTQAEKKRIRSLQVKKYRQQHREYFIEGFRLVSSAIETNPQSLKCIYVTKDFLLVSSHQTFIETLDANSISCSIISDSDMGEIANTVQSSGIAAVCHFPQGLDPAALQSSNFLYLDRVSDPGNLGTLLRTSLWFGVRHVILSEDCVDPFNPKVVRAGMGAHFSVSIFHDLNLARFKNTHSILGGDINGISISEIPDLHQPWGLVIGSEAHGISVKISDLLTHTVSITKRGDGESLNAAIAGSILLYELTAQHS